MREIKFRGLKKQYEGEPNGNEKEWVYGYLVKEGGFAYIYDEQGKKHYVNWESATQFTGLKDKNGKEIYEGNIVRILDRDWTDFEKDKINTKVVFKDGCFELETFYKNKYDNEFDYIKIYKEYGRDWFEVIGNIYENPDLLTH